MKTLKQVEIEPVFVEFIPKEMEQGKIYISKEYGVANHACVGAGGRPSRHWVKVNGR